MGGAWLCTHIWRHYTYTDDRKFLEKMYPLLKESVQFFMDFLVEKEGKLVTCPSVSPENTYIMKDGTKWPTRAHPAAYSESHRFFCP